MRASSASAASVGVVLYAAGESDDAEIDVQTFDRVEFVEGGNGNDGLIADPVAVHDESVRVGFDDFSTESCDHARDFV